VTSTVTSTMTSADPRSQEMVKVREWWVWGSVPWHLLGPGFCPCPWPHQRLWAAGCPQTSISLDWWGPGAVSKHSVLNPVIPTCSLFPFTGHAWGCLQSQGQVSHYFLLEIPNVVFYF
jgi:hypothetical protein